MARGRRGAVNPRHTPYERRIIRQTGFLPGDARARGISLARARGHAPKRAPTGELVREHQLREQRRAERGDLSEGDRTWLRAQAKRAHRDYQQLADTFRGYSPHKRAKIREIQSNARRHFVARKGSKRGPWRASTDAGSQVAAAYSGGGWNQEPAALSDYLAGSGDYRDEGEDEPEEPDLDQYEPAFDDWDDYPDMGDVEDAFLFYHDG